MKHIVITTLLIVALCFGASFIRAPNIGAVGINESRNLNIQPKTKIPSPYLISQIPDMRSTAGSAGKNIVFAEDGQNVAVIFGRFSGDPTNIFQVMVAYSTDRGNTWIHYGPLSTFNSRRTYPAIDAEDNWPQTGMVQFGWHQAAQITGSYDSSPAFYAKEVVYPYGLITSPFRLPNSGIRDVWEPCIGVKDSFVIITAVNNGCFHSWFDVYIWRTTDYGESWDTGRVFLPGLIHYYGPHFRFGNNGYMFFLWMQELETNPGLYWPYYCESFDYALTWTEPRPIVQPDTTTAWWYYYDCEVVRDTPVATVRLGTGINYGEIWVFRPDSGGPGNWRFKGKKLIDDSVGPPFYVQCPTVAADDSGSIFIGYQAIFVTPSDTGPDIGLFVRPAWKDTWVDWGRITYNTGNLEENHLEFAHNAPIVGTYPDDSVIIGMIYHNAGDYPNTGNLYFDWFAIPYDSIRMFRGITEMNPSYFKEFAITVAPNPFRNSVKFGFPFYTGKAKLSIYDVSGKLIRELTTNNKPLKTEFVWDSRKNDGSLANAGIYFYTASSGNETYQGKIILTR